MDIDLKALSEFGAEFVGYRKLGPNGFWGHSESDAIWNNNVGPALGTPLTVDELVYDFFTDPKTAPILAHIAKREIEKRGYGWISSRRYHCFDPIQYFYEFCSEEKDGMDNSGQAQHENEYIALFLAIREAIQNENKT